MNVEVNFGNNCNLNCEYCFVKRFDTDLEINSDYFIKIANWLKNIEIEHFRPVGGEPTLNIKKIDLFLMNLKSKPKAMTIVTNGTMLEILVKYLKKFYFLYGIKNITLACSIDRLGYDKYRKINSLETIVKILELKELYPFINFSINRVVSDQKEKELEEFNFFMKTHKISIYSIPFTDEKHKILSSFKENTDQIKLCGAFCKTGLYFYKENIYLCKLCQNIYKKGYLGNLNDDLETVLEIRDKYKGCTYERLNKGVAK